MTEGQENLLLQARKAALGAYVPYSDFRVGAAVLTSDGRVFTGANVENASFGLTLCAERTALSAAVTSGGRDIVGVAVACIDAIADSGAMPCGACRQWLAELAPKAWVVTLGRGEPMSVQELLPEAFIPKALDKKD